MLTAAIILIYLSAAFDTSRRLAWYWNNRPDADMYDYIHHGDRRFGALMVSVLLLPVAITLIMSAHKSIGFDKPPRSVRKAAEAAENETKMIEAKHMVEDLQREIDRLANQ